MKTSKFLKSIATASMVVVGLSALMTGSALAQRVNWVFQTTESTLTNPFTKQVVEMTRKIKERTNNNFQIRVLVAKEIGIDRSEFPDALSKGAIDMAWLLSPVMSGIYPFLGVFDLPNLTTNQESTVKVNAAVQPMLNEAVKSAGYTILPNGFFAWFPQDLLARKPIPNLANLKGMKIRVWRAPDAELIQSLGGEAIYMPVSEVYTSMQRGVMDALNTGPQAMVENSMWEIGSHYYAIRLEPGVTWTAVNEKKWKDLPAEYKTILSEELAECQKRIMTNYEVEVGKQKQVLVSKGITMHEPSAAENKAWIDASRGLWAKWAAKDAKNKRALDDSVKALGL